MKNYCDITPLTSNAKSLSIKADIITLVSSLNLLHNIR